MAVGAQLIPAVRLAEASIMRAEPRSVCRLGLDTTHVAKWTLPCPPRPQAGSRRARRKAHATVWPTVPSTAGAERID